MLKVKQIEAAQFGVSPVRMHDGNGLYLRLSKGGAKTFQLRMRDGSSTRWITLGQLPSISLRDARLKSALKKAEILDPDKPAPQLSPSLRLPDYAAPTDELPLFRDFANIWFDRKKKGLSNSKHIDQNWSKLKNYVFP